MSDLDDFERRAEVATGRTRAVLDWGDMHLLHAVAARSVGLDPAAATVREVAQALRGRPEVVADGLRLLDAEDARQATWLAQQAERRRRARVEFMRTRHGRGFRDYLKWLRSGRPCSPLPLGREAELCDLARRALGSSRTWRLRRDPERFRELVAERLCETGCPSAARMCAALWLRLAHPEVVAADAAVALVEAEIERRRPRT